MVLEVSPKKAFSSVYVVRNKMSIHYFNTYRVIDIDDKYIYFKSNCGNIF